MNYIFTCECILCDTLRVFINHIIRINFKFILFLNLESKINTYFFFFFLSVLVFELVFKAILEKININNKSSFIKRISFNYTI